MCRPQEQEVPQEEADKAQEGRAIWSPPTVDGVDVGVQLKPGWRAEGLGCHSCLRVILPTSGEGAEWRM